MQCLRPDRVLNGIVNYVNGIFGTQFLRNGLSSEIEDIIRISDKKMKWCPFLLINKKGSDASHEVERLAARNGLELSSVAMGSSEGLQLVDLAIAKGMRNGNWVLVKNAHLAITWLISLEKNMPSSTFSNDFRLFITMEPHDKIPLNLIRLSRLTVFEPPVGLKQSVMQNLNSIPKSLNSAVPVELGRLVFMLAWLHSIVTERSRYVPIGWTKNYDFNFSDFDMALTLLVSWVEDNSLGRSNIAIDKIPWDAIQNLISRTVYGGKIDREVDQDLMDIIVKEYFSPAIFDPSYHLVTEKGKLRGLQTPPGINIQSFADWCMNMQDEQSPHWISLPQKSNFLVKQKQGTNKK